MTSIPLMIPSLLLLPLHWLTLCSGTCLHPPTELFKCSTNQNLSLFPVIKQDSQFHRWKLHIVSLAKVPRHRTARRLLTPTTFPLLWMLHHCLPRNRYTCILSSPTLCLPMLESSWCNHESTNEIFFPL